MWAYRLRADTVFPRAAFTLKSAAHCSPKTRQVALLVYGAGSLCRNAHRAADLKTPVCSGASVFRHL